MKTNTSKIKYSILTLGILAVSVMPQIAHADNKSLADLVREVLKYFDLAIIAIMSLAVLVFVWNVFNYFILKSDSPAEKAEAGKYVMYSVVGFFIILSLWGLVNIATSTFQLNNRAPDGYLNPNKSSGSGAGARTINTGFIPDQNFNSPGEYGDGDSHGI